MAAAIRLGRSRSGLRPSIYPRPVGKNRLHRSFCAHCCGWSLTPSSRDGTFEREVRAVPRGARVSDIASSPPWASCVCPRETPNARRGDASPARSCGDPRLERQASPLWVSLPLGRLFLGLLQHPSRLGLKTCYRDLAVAPETRASGGSGATGPCGDRFRASHPALRLRNSLTRQRDEQALASGRCAVNDPPQI